MKYHLGIVCVLCAWPTVALSQPAVKPTTPTKAPEALLSAESLFYLRFDGFEPHRKAYDKTAFAQLMKEDLGELVDYLGSFVKIVFDKQIKQGVLDGNPPDELVKAQKALKQATQLLDYLNHHGVVVGFEVLDEGPLRRSRGVTAYRVPLKEPVVGQPPAGVVGAPQAVPAPPPPIVLPERPPVGAAEPAPGFKYSLLLIFPEGGVKKNRDMLFGAFRMFASLNNYEVKESRQSGRHIYTIDIEGVPQSWWQEGQHVVLSLGTVAAERTLAIADGKLPNLASTALNKSVVGFNRYDTFLRGHVNLHTMVDWLRAPLEVDNKLDMIKEVIARKLLINQTGLSGLRNFTFHFGFEGKYLRNTLVLNIAESKDRKGLLRLISAPVQFEPEQLPPLPPDAATVSVHHVDWLTIHDVVHQMVKLYLLGDSLYGFGGIGGDLPDIAQLLGLELRKDLLEALDSQVVLYSAMSEGPFFLGQGVAIKVKDAGKLQDSLNALGKALGKAVGDEEKIGFRQQKYRGVNFHVLTGIPAVAPTYTIHKDWLVFGLYPQIVKGYIMRTEGKHAVWKVPAATEEALALARKSGTAKTKLAAVTVSDPRPTAELLLSWAPLFVQLMNTSVRGGTGLDGFDVSKLPNAQAITEPLFPNVTVFLDDGDALRWESHASLDVPGGTSFLGLFGLQALGGLLFSLL